jgi:hypothetical protein
MSRFKNMPGVAWLVIGVCVTALVLPTAAYAAGKLKLVGIEGTSGTQADVTPASQLLTTKAQPGKLWSSNNFESAQAGMGYSQRTIALAPAGFALVIDHISASVEQLTGPGNGTAYAYYVGTSDCSRFISTTNQNFVPVYWPQQAGYTSETDTSPGVPVPAGDALCVQEIAQSLPSSLLGVSYSVTGSVVPSSSVPAAAPRTAAPRIPIP